MISPRILHIFVCCQALAEGLKRNSALANLNLSFNNIGPEGAQAWCLVRMVRILRNRSWMGGGKAIWIQTEPIEGEMVKWVKGRLHRGLVLRCAKSMMQIWVNLSLFFSFHWRPHWHDMSVWAEVWEHAVEGIEISFMWISKNLRWFHHVFCTSLFAVRHWQRDWSTTRPWQTWIWVSTTLALKGLRLGVWWGWWGFWEIGHEGGEVRQYASRQSQSKVKWWNEWKEDYTEDWCWDVPSPSCRSEWIWACSFHFIGDHIGMICQYERKYESMR